MAKMNPVSKAEVEAAMEAAFDLQQTIADIANRLEKGYADPLPNATTAARAFNALVRTTADLTTHLLAKASLDEQKRELDALMRQRAAQIAE